MVMALSAKLLNKGPHQSGGIAKGFAVDQAKTLKTAWLHTSWMEETSGSKDALLVVTLGLSVLNILEGRSMGFTLILVAGRRNERDYVVILIKGRQRYHHIIDWILDTLLSPASQLQDRWKCASR